MNKKPGAKPGFKDVVCTTNSLLPDIEKLCRLCRAAEGKAHATATGTVATTLFRRDVNDRAVLSAVGNARLNASVARERVVSSFAFCPFAAARTRERQVSHFYSSFSTKRQKRSSILGRRGSEQLS
jgi:hypothetical protein